MNGTYAQNKKSYAQYDDFAAHTEVGHDLIETARIGGRDERNRESGEGNEKGDGPFCEHGKPHGIAGVVGDILDHERVFFRPGAIAGVFEDFWHQEGVGYDKLPMRHWPGFCIEVMRRFAQGIGRGVADAAAIGGVEVHVEVQGR